MKLLQHLEKALEGGLRGLSGGNSSPREPIELYQDVLEQLILQIQAGHAGRVFPFNRVRIELAAQSADRKAALSAIFLPPKLIADFRAKLEALRTEVPADLQLEIQYLEDAASDLNLVCDRESPPAPDPDETVRLGPPPPRPAKLVIIHGVALQSYFDLQGQRINLGRDPQVLSPSGAIARHNHIHFPEDAHEANPFVSREHAHILLDAPTGEWKLFDDGSTHGTSLFRHGMRHDVPARAARGVQLRNGDEICLGQARLRFEA